MANSTSILDYLGQGAAASRPATPPVSTGAIAYYYATDTKIMSFYDWNASTWLNVRIVKAPVQKTANYTLASGDEGSYFRMNLATANTVTVPTNATVPFSTGTEITVEQMGAGVTTIVASTGVTINTPKTLTLAAKFAVVVLKKVNTDEWTLIGYTA